MTSPHEPEDCSESGFGQDRAEPVVEAAAPFWQRHWRLVAVCIAVGLAILLAQHAVGTDRKFVAVSGVVAASRSPQPSASAATSYGRLPPPSRGKTKTPEAVEAAARVAPKLAAALKRWDAARGGVELAAVTADTGEAAQTLGIKLYEPARAACAALGRAIKAARGVSPIPDAPVQKLYSVALTKLAVGAAACQAAIAISTDSEGEVQTRENVTALHTSSSDLAAGAEDLDQAASVIAAAGHH